MKKNIQSIIKDLYKIDPDLKKRGKDLEKIIKQLIDAKPNIKIDKAFVKNLKHTLSVKADELMEKAPKRSGWLNFIYVFGGTAAALVVIIIIFGQNKIALPTHDEIMRFNINDITEESPAEIDIEVTPIIKTQKALTSDEATGELSDENYADRMINENIDGFYEIEEDSSIDTGGVFFDGPVTGSTSETALEEPEIDPYYIDLLESCGMESDPDCCFASVEIMIAGGYLLMTEDGCADGMRIGELNCGSHIMWCEPE